MYCLWYQIKPSLYHKVGIQYQVYLVYTAKTENRYCEVTDDDCMPMPVTIYLRKDDLVTFIILALAMSMLDIKC